MRVTIDVDAGVLAEVERHAAERGTTVSGVIEVALGELFARRDEPIEEPFRTITYRGRGLLPGVDLDDNAALLDATS